MFTSFYIKHEYVKKTVEQKQTILTKGTFLQEKSTNSEINFNLISSTHHLLLHMQIIMATKKQ